MQVEITDDKKEKYQSFEAIIESSMFGPMSSISYNITGYGATELEARQNLKSSVRKAIASLETISEIKD